MFFLLAYVFEKYKNNSLKSYGLCPSHYLITPGLSWDAILKMIKIQPELIPDPDVYIFFQKGARGGISYIFNKYSKTNNKYLRRYDTKQKPKHVVYLDANNLYGYAISKFLPTTGFKRIYLKEFDLIKYTSNNSKRCVLEVDLEYSKEL